MDFWIGFIALIVAFFGVYLYYSIEKKAGPQGATGPRGETGRTGPQGDTGADGARGADGTASAKRGKVGR